MITACEWFARCENETAYYVEHPVLGPVPCCERCATLLDITPRLKPITDTVPISFVPALRAAKRLAVAGQLGVMPVDYDNI